MASSTSAATLISSAAQLKVFISSISPSNTLYLDLEGKSLSRHGTITLITILIHPQGAVGLIDVLALGKSSFTTISSSGRNLKSILEDPGISKCLWDVRNDADALWALFNVGLAGVIDIQLLENASRAGDKKYVCGLDKAVQYDLKLGFMDLNRWIQNKKEIKSRMAADIFTTRPMEAKTIQYCVNDVIHLPNLHDFYLQRIGEDWLTKRRKRASAGWMQPIPRGTSPSRPRRPWDHGVRELGGTP